MHGGPGDNYDYRGPHGPNDQQNMPEQGNRSKSVTNLMRPDQHNDPRQNNSMGTLPRSQGPHPGQPMPPYGAPPQHIGNNPHDINRHVSQPELSKRDDGPINDYENYPGRYVDPRQADYVNQRDLKAQQGSQSMYNLTDDPRQMNKPDDMNHMRVREWQQRNDMVQRRDDQFNPPNQFVNSLPKDAQRGRMQQPPGGRPYDQQQQRPPFGQQNFGPAQGYPPQTQQNFHAPTQQVQSPTYPQHSDHATYQNVPQNQFPNQKTDPARDKMGPIRRTASPELPPPPDVPPELPPPPEEHRNTQIEDLPPPPPQVFDQRSDSRLMPASQKVPPPGPGFHSNQAPQQYQNYQNYQNLPPSGGPQNLSDARSPMSQGAPKYTQSPTTQQPQYPYQPRPAPAGSQDKLPAKINTLGGSLTNLQRTTNEPQKPALKQDPNKKAPPIAAKPKLNLAAEIKKSLASPWEREEKERELKRREEEMKQNRDVEIRELESRNYLLPEEQERLKR
jgi:hypothetical protein